MVVSPRGLDLPRRPIDGGWGSGLARGAVADEDQDRVVVKGVDVEEVFQKSEVLQQNCAVCIHRNPVVYDELVADLVEEQTDVDRYADVDKIEALSAEERWQYFDDLLSECIRCYACRNACPLVGGGAIHTDRRNDAHR